MSDRYLYKAKRTDNKEWVEGYYFRQQVVKNSPAEKNFIIVSEFPKYGKFSKLVFYEVDSATLCQCTGYKGIWEHDIFQYDEDRYQIVFDEESLTWQAESIFSSESIELGEFYPEEIDVIGNIFDNPELLEVES